MRLPQTPHHLLLILLPFLPAFVLSQGTVTLNLATTADETSTTLSVPFNKLFSSITQKGVSIQVSAGSNVPIPDSNILCQCFSDTAGTQPLGATFDNVFPGVEFSTEPVKIGAVLCSDKQGLATKMGDSGAGAGGAGSGGNGNGNEAQSSPAEVTTSTSVSAAQGQITTQPASLPPPTTTTSPPPPPPSTTTAATSPLATSTASLNPNPNPNINASPPSTNNNNNSPTASLRFSLSTNPSDDSSTQISIPINNSIFPLTSPLNKNAKGVTVSGISPPSFGSAGKLVCQVFADKGAKMPVGEGFGVDDERVLGEEGGVGSVGCAMVGGGEFGGVVGLVGM